MAAAAVAGATRWQFGAGVAVQWMCGGTEVVWWCSGGVEVRRCSGGVVVQRRCGGGVVVQRRCGGAAVQRMCGGGARHGGSVLCGRGGGMTHESTVDVVVAHVFNLTYIHHISVYGFPSIFPSRSAYPRRQHGRRSRW